ncbi:type II toxin-antitoxin system HicA family toxin [Gemmata sp. JC673]|uniref:Type II toxin-antitoxin system HicA family toxin n=2 Tax=Gemmata algarum TaxID=2975278 RepID=A0ABU5F0G2_9BACT|nr:type II toxin-antitoxin system HicA family toxin [Gemmata algarum]
MDRRELEEHLRDHNCELLRHGSKHDVWANRETNATTTIPRHRTLRKNTARNICDDLGVPRPGSL